MKQITDTICRKIAWQTYAKALFPVMLFTGFTGLFNLTHAQVVITELTNGGTSYNTSATYGPIYQSGQNGSNARHIYLFTQEEMLAAGIFPGSVISSLAWYKTNDAILTNGAQTILHIFQRSGSALTEYGSGIVVADYIDTSAAAGNGWEHIGTAAYNADTPNLPAVATWMEIPVTPFVYTGGSLEIFIHNILVKDVGNVTNKTLAWRRESGPYTTVYNTSATNTVFNRQSYRPDIQIKFTRPANRAQVFSIAEPVYFCPGTQDIKVTVNNNGSNIIDSVEIHWMKNGVLQTPIVYKTPIDMIGSVAGNTAIVTLQSNVNFSPADSARIKAWTALPNGVSVPVAPEDTLDYLIKPALSGTYTVGGVSPDYTTVIDAVNDLHLYGICGAVVLDIRPGTYEGSMIIGKIPNASPVNTVTFRSSTGVAQDVVIANPASSSSNNYVFQLSNATDLIFKNISMAQTGTSTLYTSVLSIGDTSLRITVDSCILSAPTAIGNSLSNSIIGMKSGNIVANNFSGTGIKITNTVMRGGAIGLMYEGSSSANTLDGSGFVFDNNTVENFGHTGLHVQYVRNLKLRNNVISSDAQVNNSQRYGANIQTVLDTLYVTGNRIKLRPGTNSTASVNGLYFKTIYSSPTSKNIIANNEIVIASTDGNTTANAGLYVDGAGYQEIYNNSVNVIGGAPDYTYAAYFKFSGGASEHKVFNNVFANSDSGRAVYMMVSTSADLEMDFNNIYTNASGGVLVNKDYDPKVLTTSLAQWRTASGFDKNSISYRPGFTNDTSLMPDPADSASWSLNGRGVHWPGNISDINGNTRSEIRTQGVPDIGAYEFTPVSLPPLATPSDPVIIVGVPQVFLFGEDTVASIVWNGTNLPTSVEVRQYSGTQPPSYTGNDTIFFYTSVAAPGGPFDYNPGIYYKEPWLGSIKTEPGIRLSQRIGSNPWNFHTGTASGADEDRNLISASGLTELGLFSAVGETCNGQPAAPVITTPATTVSQCPGSVFVLAAADPDAASGIVYQWQQADNSAGPWVNIPGATTLNYITDPVHSASYYRVRSLCVAANDSAFSNAYEIQTQSPAQVISTQDGSRCGPGSVMLSATGSPDATLYWYDDSTGGSLIDTGNIFHSPLITGNTTYYVAASSNTKEEFIPGPEPGTALATPGGERLKFRVNTLTTINSIDIYQNRSSAKKSRDTSIKDIQKDSVYVIIYNMPDRDTFAMTADYEFYADTTGIKQETIPVNITLPAGEYQIAVRYRGSGLRFVRTSSYNIFIPLDYPYESPSGAVSIFEASSSSGTTTQLNNFHYMYNWSITTPCESPRVAAHAVLGDAPPFAVTETPVVCNDGIATLSISPATPGYDSVTWTPYNNLFTNAAGTIAYTGGNATTIYMRTTDSGIHRYIASGYNTITGCANLDTTEIWVLPARATATANPPDICFSGSTTLRLDHEVDFAPGALQWQQSSNGITYTDIPGANGNNYTTSGLNDNTYFRAAIKNSAGDVCATVPLAVTVNKPQVINQTAGSHCGPGEVTLSATGSAGSKLNWYDASGTLLDTGLSYTSPAISQTTTYYVAAENGKRARYLGKQYRTLAGVADTDGGLVFDANVPITIESVAVYPVGTGSGTVRIALVNSSNIVLDSTTVTLTGTPLPGIKTIVPLGFSVPVGSGFKLLLRNRTGGVTGLVRESAVSTSGEINYPYSIIALASITGASTTVFGKNYPFFFDWKISQPCESPQTPVTATITPAPAFTAESVPATICVGDTAMLTATSANSGYTYEWTPGPMTGGSVPVSPSARTVYYIKALDNSGGPNDGCVGYDSVTVEVNALPAASLSVAGNTTFCDGDSVLLFASTGAGYSYQWQRDNADIPGAVNSSFYAKEDGLHTVRITDVNSCSATSDPEDITVHPAPEPVIAPDGNGLTTGSFNSYQWYRNGTLIPGATNRQHTPEGAGNYTVAVTDANGCEGLSEPYSFTVGVQHINNRPDVRIYPNPASSTVYIESPVPVQVTLSSVDGKVIFHQKGVQQIDISSLSDAVYMIRVADLDGQVLNLSRLIKAAK